MTTPQEDPLEIPAFLRRKPDTGKRRKPRLPPVQPGEEAVSAAREPEKLERVELTEFVRLAETPYEESGFAIDDGVIPRRHYDGNPESEQVIRLHLMLASRAMKAEEKAEKKAKPTRAEKLAGTLPLSDITDRIKGGVETRLVKKALKFAGLRCVKNRISAEDLAAAVKAVTEYKPGARRPKSADLFAEDGVIVCKLRKNPKKEGTGAHGRWALLMESDGKTVGEFLKDGGNPTTLKNAVTSGHAKVREVQKTADEEATDAIVENEKQKPTLKEAKRIVKKPRRKR